MEWWQSILLTLATVGVPLILAYFLNKRGANKRLVLEERGSDVTVFTAQSVIYQDLLDRATETIKELENHRKNQDELVQTVKLQGEEITALKEADGEKQEALNETNDKLNRLRELFTSYIDRVGTVPLTTEEIAIFDATMPTKTFRRKLKRTGE